MSNDELLELILHSRVLSTLLGIVGGILCSGTFITVGVFLLFIPMLATSITLFVVGGIIVIIFTRMTINVIRKGSPAAQQKKKEMRRLGFDVDKPRMQSRTSNISKKEPPIVIIDIDESLEEPKKRETPSIKPDSFQSVYQEFVDLAVNTNTTLTIVQKIEFLLLMGMIPSHIPLLLGEDPKFVVDIAKSNQETIKKALEQTENKDNDLESIFGTKKIGPVIEKRIEQMKAEGASDKEIEAFKERISNIEIRQEPKNACINGFLHLKKVENSSGANRQFELMEAFICFSEALRTDPKYVRAAMGLAISYNFFGTGKERVGEWLARTYTLDSEYVLRTKAFTSLDQLKSILTIIKTKGV